MVALKGIARAYSAHHSERSCSALAPAPEWWTATPSRSLLQVGCAHLESRWSRFDLGWALSDHRRAHRWAGARRRPHAKGAGSGAAVGPPGQQGRASICAWGTRAGQRFLFQYNHALRTIRPHNSAPHNSAVRADLFGSEKSSTICGLIFESLCNTPPLILGNPRTPQTSGHRDLGGGTCTPLLLRPARARAS